MEDSVVSESDGGLVELFGSSYEVINFGVGVSLGKTRVVMKVD